jgi:hypothetical protein
MLLEPKIENILNSTTTVIGYKAFLSSMVIYS